MALTDKASQALMNIREGTLQAEIRVSEIAGATQEQSVASNEIAKNVERVAHMAEENDFAVGETARDAQQIGELAGRLHNLVSRFST